MKHLVIMSSILILGLATNVQSQEMSDEIQNLANELALQGYSEFKLKKSFFGGVVLTAIGENDALVLKLDPNTSEVLETRVANDADGDGVFSKKELKDATLDGDVPVKARAQGRPRPLDKQPIEGAERKSGGGGEKPAGGGGKKPAGGGGEKPAGGGGEKPAGGGKKR